MSQTNCTITVFVAGIVGYFFEFIIIFSKKEKNVDIKYYEIVSLIEL